jgi:translation initiation factor IF-2
MGMGMMVTVNQTIDHDTASIVASEFGFEVKNKAFAEEDLLNEVTDLAVDENNLLPRAPVVTVMGHVDHGKTSLLDAIRNTNVTAGEAGGITQHIGAYSVNSEKGLLTFLDTPGHEAFTSMRARGAHVTDVVVLVVAADDGVMPQTREAINHAKDAKSPLVVAINKCDKPDSRPERVMQELTEHGLVPEEWGGDTMMVQVSALKREGIDQLLESILLQAEVLELKADPGRKAQGAIVEAQLDKGRGPVATILVQQGTLRTGDYIIAGEHSGRVRAMYDSYGEKMDEAGPSTPVQVLGLGGVPSAGDQLNAVADEKSARRVAEHRAQKIREVELQQTSRVSLENFLNKPVSEQEGHELRLLVKADVDGSVEALRQALENLTTRKVKVNIVHSGVGTITESDVNLAVASGAIIIGFNAKADAKAHVLAQHEKVDVRTYSVIYEALDEVRDAMAGLLAPKLEERSLGVAEVRALFTVPKLGTIAGSYVLEGKITRNGKIRVRRGKEVLHEGGVASLRRFKDDVRDVAAGYECGIGVTGFSSLQEGDQLECFDIQEVKAELDEALVNLEEKPAVEAQAGVSA